MPEQLYWEDVSEGMEIPAFDKIATTQMLVRWAGASGDFNPLHYDAVFAAAIGTGRPIVHGALKRQWLIQLATDWMGAAGFLKKFSCQYRAMDYPRNMQTMTVPLAGETWHCKGKVIKKYIEGLAHQVDCDLKLENGKGEVTTSARATVILPSRNP
ncbi:MAG: MaoC/PaaZ C-terminal domain-containing protein [Dehalococcoidales bacterium]|nr:MaoC/PaaZ C-terminal domain-containing protein [Dehalococcoidales bacterium]